MALSAIFVLILTNLEVTLKEWEDEDWARLQFFKETRVLVPVNLKHAEGSEGSVVLFCGDGDQVTDLVDFHRSMQQVHRPNPLIHKLALNGGALRLWGMKRGRPARQLLLDDIQDALRMNGMTRIGIYVHGPCRYARLHRITFSKVIEGAVRARRLLETFAGVTVTTFCHIDTGKDQRTYTIDCMKWSELRIPEAVS